MYRKGHSGKLVVKNEHFSCNLFFNGGNISRIQAEDMSYTLGQYFVKRRVVSEETIRELLPLTSEDNPLGKVLQEKKKISADLVKKSLIDLHAQILSKTLLYRDGAFTLDRETRVDHIEPITSNANLIIHACRYLDDDFRMMQLLGGQELYLIFSRDPFLLFQDISLYPEEYFLVSRFQDFSRVSDYLKLYPDKKRQISRILFGLVSAGVLELVTRQEALVERFERDSWDHGMFEVLNIHEPVEKNEIDDFEEKVEKKLNEIKTDNFYEILGLPSGTSQREIREKFLEMARIFHPDQAHLQKNPDLKSMLTTITAALRDSYETLSHPEKRRLYDLQMDEDKVYQKAKTGRRNVQIEIAQKNYERALLYLQESDTYSAYELLSQALRFVPDNRDYLMELCRLEKKNPRWVHRTVRRLEEFLESNSDDAEAHELIADIYASNGLNTRAKEHYKITMKLDPSLEGIRKKIKELSS